MKPKPEHEAWVLVPQPKCAGQASCTNTINGLQFFNGWTKWFWSWREKLSDVGVRAGAKSFWMPGARVWNLSSGSTALVLCKLKTIKMPPKKWSYKRLFWSLFLHVIMTRLDQLVAKNSITYQPSHNWLIIFFMDIWMQIMPFLCCLLLTDCKMQFVIF